MGKFYSLLTSVGIYEQNLSLLSYEMDLKLMENALIEGLRLSKDTIRTLGSSGIVKMRSFVRVLMEFSSMIEEEDGFILYFSGHGCNGDLCFSDGMINIQSIIDFVEKLKSKNKIIILDCCYSGKFYVSGAKQMKLEEAITTFAGNGTVVLASSSSNESSWLGPGKNHSLYTGMLTTAITVNRRIRKGKISIFDIHEEVLAIAKAWNKNNPNKMQHPIYRGRIGGTIYFEVEKYTPYETLQVYLKAENYTIRNVEPLSLRKEKRLAVFVMISEKYCAEKQLALITKEIVSYVRNLNVFSTAASETKFKNMSARAVWCYFGHDESDMVNHRYFARSIWACDRSGKKKYYSEQKNSSIIKQSALYDTEFAATLAMKILCAKIKNQSVVLRRYEKSRGINLEEEQKMLTICKNKIMTCNRIEEMIGFEGQAAKYYFKGLAACIDKEFSFQGRSRRPPRDEFNSMISLGYSILMNEVYCKIEMKGLNPYFGFIHRDAEKHPTLASDMMEEWRAVIVDATAMSMINGHEIQKEHFNFSMDEPGCYLTRDGLKIYLNKLERKFQTEVRYLKYVDYAVSFRRGIFLQMEHLAKAIEEGDANLYEPITIR